MNWISISYDLIWEFKDYPNYKVSKCGKVFNMKTNRKIKKVVNGRSIGFWIKGKFITLNNSRKLIRKIEKLDMPF